MTPQHTRSDYRSHKCSHRDYYAQFVNKPILSLISTLRPRILASKDPHLNDIPLSEWDRLSDLTRACIDKTLWREAECPQLPLGSYTWSLSSNICILKEAARQLQEKTREPHTPSNSCCKNKTT